MAYAISSTHSRTRLARGQKMHYVGHRCRVRGSCAHFLACLPMRRMDTDAKGNYENPFDCKHIPFHIQVFIGRPGAHFTITVEIWRCRQRADYFNCKNAPVNYDAVRVQRNAVRECTSYVFGFGISALAFDGQMEKTICAAAACQARFKRKL